MQEHVSPVQRSQISVAFISCVICCNQFCNNLRLQTDATQVVM